MAGAGAGLTVRIMRHSQWKREQQIGRAYGLPRQSSTLHPELITESQLERSRRRSGHYACDTPNIMGCQSVLNRFSPLTANLLSFNLLQAKIDSIPIA
jgi:hypothetical protein